MNSSIYFLCLVSALSFLENSSHSFLLETNFGKLLRSTANAIDTTESTSEYRKLDRNAIISAFKSFREIVDDPMVLNERAMNYDIPDVIKTKGFVRNLSVVNLKNTSLDHIFIADDDSYGELKISFPSLIVSGSYNMTFEADRHNITVYGNGSFSIELNNFQVSLNVSLRKTKLGYTDLNKIDWNQTLGGVKIEIKNLLDDEEASAVFSENLSAVVPTLHNAYKPLIDDFMGRAVTVYWKILFLKPNTAESNLERIIQTFVQQAASTKN